MSYSRFEDNSNDLPYSQFREENQLNDFQSDNLENIPFVLNQKKSNNDFIISLIILILGIVFFRVLLLINILYIRSHNKSARIVAYISLTIFIIHLIFTCCISIIGVNIFILYIIFIVVYINNL